MLPLLGSYTLVAGKADTTPTGRLTMAAGEYMVCIHLCLDDAFSSNLLLFHAAVCIEIACDLVNLEALGMAV